MLAFTVEDTGGTTARTTDATSTSFSAALDRCFVQMMEGWRFPAPKDKHGDPSTAKLTITMRLIPD